MLYSSYREVEAELIEQLYNEQLVHAKQAANNISTFFQEFQDQLSYLASTDEIIKMDHEGQELLAHFFRGNSGKIKAITRIDSTGRIIYSYPYNKNVVGMDISYQEHIQRLIRTKQPVLSRVFKAVQGYNSIAFYIPVFNQGHFEGGIAVLIPFDNFTGHILKEIKVRHSGFAWIMNQDGVILYNPLSYFNAREAQKIFKNSPTALNMINQALTGKAGRAKFSTDLVRNRDNETEWYAVYYPVNINDSFWTLVVTTPENEILKTMRGFLIKLLLIFMLLAGASIIYIYYINRARAVLREEAARRESDKALRSSERKFRTLVELSPDAITLADIEGRIITSNKKAAELVGYDSPDEYTGKNLLDFIVPEDRAMALANIKALLNGGVRQNLQYTLIRKDGTRFPAEISAAVIMDKDGNPASVTSVVRDITERKIAEQVMIEAKEKAEKSDKLKSEFLAQMSHEIRSPINSILSFSSLLKDELQDSVSEDLSISFSAIDNAGKRIIRTIDLILNMSEIQTGAYEPSFRRVMLSREILERLFLEFRHMSQEKGIELIYSNVTGCSDITITADEYTLGQIFNNLINNALKYTEKGRVEVLLLITAAGNPAVEIRDTGIGISKEYLPRLFVPFSQEEQGYTRRFEGNGLGLALVKKYCDINGLSIEVESIKGEGTVFRIVFPMDYEPGN